MSTRPGHSGAPIFQDGRIVAIHLGAKPEEEVNYCVSLRGLPSFLLQPQITVQESDAPDRSIDRHEREEDIQEALAISIARASVGRRDRELWDDVWSSVNTFVYDPDENSLEFLRDHVDRLRDDVYNGDEDASRIIRVFERLNGTSSRGRGSGGLKERVLGSSTGHSTTSLSNRHSLIRTTPWALGSSFVDKQLELDQKQKSEIALLSKQLDDLRMMISSLHENEKLPKVSDNSLNPLGDQKPSLEASATKPAASSRRVKGTSAKSSESSKV